MDGWMHGWMDEQAGRGKMREASHECCCGLKWPTRQEVCSTCWFPGCCFGGAASQRRRGNNDGGCLCFTLQSHRHRNRPVFKQEWNLMTNAVGCAFRNELAGSQITKNFVRIHFEWNSTFSTSWESKTFSPFCLTDYLHLFTFDQYKYNVKLLNLFYLFFRWMWMCMCDVVHNMYCRVTELLFFFITYNNKV